MASKTSAVADNEPVDVLFALHDKFDFLDFAGPLEVLTTALHDINDPCKHPTPAQNLCVPTCPSPGQPAKLLLLLQPPRPSTSPSLQMSPRRSLPPASSSALRSHSKRPMSALRTLTLSSSWAEMRSPSSRPRPSPSRSSRPTARFRRRVPSESKQIFNWSTVPSRGTHLADPFFLFQPTGALSSPSALDLSCSLSRES